MEMEGQKSISLSMHPCESSLCAFKGLILLFCSGFVVIMNTNQNLCVTFLQSIIYL